MTGAVLPNEADPTWTNWTQNITYLPPSGSPDYYFAPTTLPELKAIVARAETANAIVRVSGQRHSQAPLVIGSQPDTSGRPSWLVDMACYADLGPEGDQAMVVDAANLRITVNTGVREDAVDALLTQNDLMMRTVTAGGFFSVGGMTAVDVHGATVAAPCFAGTVSAFTILRADGSVVTIDSASPAVDGWSPLQFARVNLGGLGIVTSVTIDVLPRPYATTLKGGSDTFDAPARNVFGARFHALLTAHDRIETFYNPYFVWPITNEYYAAWWDVVPDPADKVPNRADPVATACTLAAADSYGAPMLPAEKIAEEAGILAQKSKLSGGALTVAGMTSVASSVADADRRNSDLWLTEAARVMFMSYFLPLSGIDAVSLGKVWDGLQVVGRRMAFGSPFHIAAPMEFRFVTGSDAAMAGTYATDPDAVFVNLDLIGFVEATPTDDYPPALLRFFAEVEREWVAMGGLPHQGKMYGFYDPAGPPDNYGAAFNPAFLADLRTRRGAPLHAYAAYRRTQDPDGRFYNAHLRALLGD